MIFVFGGAYQGMEDYAREQCGAAEIVHLTENDAQIDFSTGAVAGLERYVLGCVRRGVSRVKPMCSSRERSRIWQQSLI